MINVINGNMNVIINVMNVINAKMNDDQGEKLNLLKKYPITAEVSHGSKSTAILVVSMMIMIMIMIMMMRMMMIMMRMKSSAILIRLNW